MWVKMSWTLKVTPNLWQIANAVDQCYPTALQINWNTLNTRSLRRWRTTGCLRRQKHRFGHLDIYTWNIMYARNCHVIGTPRRLQNWVRIRPFEFGNFFAPFWQWLWQTGSRTKMKTWNWFRCWSTLGTWVGNQSPVHIHLRNEKFWKWCTEFCTALKATSNQAPEKSWINEIWIARNLTTVTGSDEK